MNKKFKYYLMANNKESTYACMSFEEKELVKDVWDSKSKELEGLKELFFESYKNMSIVQIARAAHSQLKSQVINGYLKEGNSDFDYWQCVDGFMTTFNRRIKKFI